MNNENTTTIQEYSAIDAAVATLRHKHGGKLFDVTTTDGMKEARAARREVKEFRVELEKLRKQIKAPALERCQMIDSEAKRITSALVEIESPIDDQIKAEENRIREEKEAAERAERERVQAIRDRIGKFDEALSACVGATSEKIRSILAWVRDESLSDIDFAEYTDEVHQKRSDAMTRIERALDDAERNEREAERLRLEREALERELAAEAERQAAARAEEERREREALEKARQEREDLEAERARLDAEAAKSRPGKS